MTPLFLKQFSNPRQCLPCLGRGVLLRKAIVRPSPVLADLHQAGLFQYAHMLRYRRWGQAQQLDDLANAKFAAIKGHQRPDAIYGLGAYSGATDSITPQEDLAGTGGTYQTEYRRILKRSCGNKEIAIHVSFASD